MTWHRHATDFLSESLSSPRTQTALVAVAGASFTLAFLLPSLLSRRGHESRVLQCPSPALSHEHDSEHPLPSDVLPGARDVATPYGSIRVYEWGPEDGQKVLFVHGITTPCIALGGVAHALVDRGFRVMLFDL